MNIKNNIMKFREQQQIDHSHYNYKRFSKEIEEAIIRCYLEPYGNIGLVCKKFKTSSKRVRAMLQSRGIVMKEMFDLRKRKKYTLNEHFFEDSERWTKEQAYFFGWICSDGHVGDNEIQLTLQEQDVDILEKFKKIIDYTGIIKYIKARRMSNFINTNYMSKPQYKLSIASHKMIQSLRNLNILSNKTYTLEFPKWIKKDLLSSFIKGYWEGDGTVTGQQHNIYIGITGNKNFCLELRSVLESELKVTTFYGFTNINTHYVRICGRCQVVRFLNWIYQDNSIVLNRKYRKYLNLIKELKYNTNIPNKTKEEIEKCKEYNNL